MDLSVFYDFYYTEAYAFILFLSPNLSPNSFSPRNGIVRVSTMLPSMLIIVLWCAAPELLLELLLLPELLPEPLLPEPLPA